MWFEDVYKGRNDCGKPLSLLYGTKTDKKKLLKKVTIFILKNKKQDHLENTLGAGVGNVIDFFLFLR